jgi:hypothetical protein
MRVAVIVVTILVMTTPSGASASCMSKAEARQHFPSVHIYWHGPGRCWDATPAQSHQIIHQVQRRTPIRGVQRKEDQPRIDQPKSDQSRSDQSRINQPKWRDSISEMLADSDPEQTIGASRVARHDGNDDVAASEPRIDRWIDRWVDVGLSPLAERTLGIAPVAPPPIIERETEPLITLRGVVLVCLALVLALATIEVLFVGVIYQRAKSG